MNHTTDHKLEQPSGPPSLQLSTEPNTTNASAPSRSDQLPSEVRTLHTLQGLRVAKAQAESMEASIKVQIAQEHLEEARHDRLASQLMILPHQRMHLQVYNDGLSWIAAYICPEGEPLVGRGDTPQLALTDFDQQWLGLK